MVSQSSVPRDAWHFLGLFEFTLWSSSSKTIWFWFRSGDCGGQVTWRSALHTPSSSALWQPVWARCSVENEGPTKYEPHRMLLMWNLTCREHLLTFSVSQEDRVGGTKDLKFRLYRSNVHSLCFLDETKPSACCFPLVVFLGSRLTLKAWFSPLNSWCRDPSPTRTLCGVYLGSNLWCC